MPDSKMLIGLQDFEFERRRNAGENEAATVSQTPDKHGRHINQWSGEDVRDVSFR
jgi:hypothetical protein